MPVAKTSPTALVVVKRVAILAACVVFLGPAAMARADDRTWYGTVTWETGPTAESSCGDRCTERWEVTGSLSSPEGRDPTWDFDDTITRTTTPPPGLGCYISFQKVGQFSAGHHDAIGDPIKRPHLNGPGADGSYSISDLGGWLHGTTTTTTDGTDPFTLESCADTVTEDGSGSLAPCDTPQGSIPAGPTTLPDHLTGSDVVQCNNYDAVVSWDLHSTCDTATLGVSVSGHGSVLSDTEQVDPGSCQRTGDPPPACRTSCSWRFFPDDLVNLVAAPDVGSRLNMYGAVTARPPTRISACCR